VAVAEAAGGGVALPQVALTKANTDWHKASDTASTKEHFTRDPHFSPTFPQVSSISPHNDTESQYIMAFN